ncbi:methyl-accepting chemotaxis protein [Salinispirillum sp. LH 10-3-1]|uniref:Methyl-accepting chemotaxis protein n=1 Tax=Salinispirillum sp. LH 10-3-1 TaxID=2952525 RepID=A0AB38YHS8_9GAMM
MKFGNLSIRMQMLVTMALALVFALGSSSVLYTRMIVAQADSAILETALPAQAEAVRNALSTIVEVPVAHAAAVANDEYVRRWMAAGEPANQNDDIVAYLRRHADRHGALSAYVVSASTGAYWTEVGQTRTMLRNDPAFAWFFALLDGSVDPVVTGAVNIDTGDMSLFINHKMRDLNGRVTGIGGMALSLEAAVDTVRRYSIGEGGRLYTVTSNGIMMIHDDLSLVSNEVTLADYTSPQIAQSLLRSREFELERFVRDGVPMLVASLPLEALDWQLIIEIPEAEVYAESRNALLVASMIGLVILVVSLLLTTVVTSRLMRPVRAVSEALLEISSGEGDLTRQLPENRKDELGDLARGFNRFVSSLSGLIADVRQSNEQLHGIIGQVVDIVQRTQGSAAEQNQMTDSVATAMHEMSTTVGEITRNANETASYSQEAASAAEQADTRVEASLQNSEVMRNEIGSASSSLTDLVADVDNIVKVTEVIRDISEQTNLLALNAAIEAARAGESGRGFAVVADEVRTLASRTRSSTEDIQARIQQLQEGSQRAVTSMNAGQSATEAAVSSAQETREALRGIHEQLMQVVDMNHQIATATEEQSAVTDDVNKHVQGISDVARSSAEELEACVSACTDMMSLAEDLRKRLGRFKTE